MGKEKITVRSLHGRTMGIWGTKDKGLLGTRDNLEDAQGRWQALNPIDQTSQALPKVTETATGSCAQALSAQGPPCWVGTREGLRAAAFTT